MTSNKISLSSILSFFLNRINKNLTDIPSTSELLYSISSRHSLTRKMQINTKAIVNCDFGAAVLDSDDFIVHIYMKNNGPISTEW